MRLEVIKTKLSEIIKADNLTIYSIKPKKEFGEKILEILLKGKDINTNVLEAIHLQLFEALEEGDLPDDYFLELSSMGAEYPLNSLSEISEHLNFFVEVRTSKYSLIGYVLEIEGQTITFEYNDKGQFRKKKIKYDEIVNITTRVKV